MALFTDGLAVTAEGLARYETSVLEVMRLEDVPARVKIEVAQEECGQELSDFVRRSGRYTVWDDRELLRHVVVDARLRRWIALRALSSVFGEVYNKQLNDRYSRKQDEYKKAAAEARDSYLANGVGMVNTPIARADQPALSAITGQGTAQTVYVAVAAVMGAAEGSASEPAVIVLAAGNDVQIRTAGMSAWNVYAGNSLATLTRQNDEPLLGSEWVLTDLRMNGEPPPAGQASDVLVRWQRRLRRG